MTDRVKGVSITLKHDVRIDDMDLLHRFLALFPFVAQVDFVLAKADDFYIATRVRAEIAERVTGALWVRPKPEGKEA